MIANAAELHRKLLDLRAYVHVLCACLIGIHMQFPFAGKSPVHLSMLLSPCVALISLAMALSQHGSLPDPSADTHAHFLALPRRLRTVEEATYTGGLLVREVESMDRAKGLDPSHTLIHIP